jgi:hypothetical protein
MRVIARSQQIHGEKCGLTFSGPAGTGLALEGRPQQGRHKVLPGLFLPLLSALLSVAWNVMPPIRGVVQDFLTRLFWGRDFRSWRVDVE